MHIAERRSLRPALDSLDEEGTPARDQRLLSHRAVPMLPGELSTGICSLNPGVDRLVMFGLLEIDHQGDVVREEFVRGVIRSAARMTYTRVHELLEGDPTRAGASRSCAS